MPPNAVRLHDLDGDGHADLFVDDRTPKSIRVFACVGDGTLAHLNDDEFLDLLTPNSDHIAILIGLGSGTFALTTSTGSRSSCL